MEALSSASALVLDLLALSSSSSNTLSSPFPLLSMMPVPPQGTNNNYQQQQQSQHPQQQQQQMQQLQNNQQQQAPSPPPPPPPANGLTTMDGGMTLAGVLHFLQTEWRRWERDRNEWEIERAEMRARIALLEGERRSAENLKLDLSRRVKMLEFALRQERAKHTAPPPSTVPSTTPATAIPPGKLLALQAETEGKEGTSTSSEGGSDDGAPSSLPNGATSSSPLPSGPRAGSALPNGAPVPAWKTGVAAAGRDPKSRQRSRDYLKQCLQEITYLTSPGALNPLPNRPIVLPPPPPSPNDAYLNQAAQFRQVNSVPSQQTPPPQNHQQQQPLLEQPAQPPQPNILQRPRKHLPDHVAPSPIQGVPPTIQEQQDIAAERERAVEREREREIATAEELRLASSSGPSAEEEARAASRMESAPPPASEESSEVEPTLSSEARSVSPVPILPPSSSHSSPSSASSAEDGPTSSPPSSELDLDDDHPADSTIVHLSKDQPSTNGSLEEDEPSEEDLYDEKHSEEDDEHEPLESVPLNESSANEEETTRIVDDKAEEEDERSDEEEEGRNRLTAIFRPQDKGDWKEALKAAGASIESVVPALTDEGSTSPEQTDEDRLANLTLGDDHFDDEDEESPSAGTTAEGGAWRARRTLKSHLDAVRAIAFHETDLCFATASDDCTVKVWRIDPVELLPERTTPSKDTEPQMTYRGHTHGVTSVVVSASQQRIYSGSQDSTIRVWKLPSPDHELYSDHDPDSCIATLVGHSDSVWALTLIGSRLVSASSDGLIKVWDTDTTGVPLVSSWGYFGMDPEDVSDGEEKEHKLVGLDGERIVPTSLAPVGASPKLVAVGFSDSIVKLFDLETGKEVSRMQSDESYDGTAATQINAIATHPTASVLVSAHEDKLIRFFNLSTGEQTDVLPAHSDAVTSLAISPLIPNILVSGGHDSSVRIWDLSTKTFVQELTLHRRNKDQGVLAVSMHPERKILASAGADGIVKLLTWVEGRA